MPYCKLNRVFLKVKIIKNITLSDIYIYHIMVLIILEKLNLSVYPTSNFFDQAVLDKEDVLPVFTLFGQGLTARWMNAKPTY